jgi:LysM repeat protein
MSGQSPGSLRVLAPVALVTFGIVFLIVVFSSLSGGDDTPEPAADLGADQSKVKKVKTKTEDSLATTTDEFGSDATTDEFGTESTETDAFGTETSSTALSTTKSTYTVKPGDTLEGISAKTGISVDELTSLNPDVDPQALTSGSKLTLTE